MIGGRTVLISVLMLFFVLPASSSVPRMILIEDFDAIT